MLKLYHPQGVIMIHIKRFLLGLVFSTGLLFIELFVPGWVYIFTGNIFTAGYALMAFPLIIAIYLIGTVFSDDGLSSWPEKPRMK